MGKNPSQSNEDKAKAIIRSRGGTIRFMEALQAGIHRRTLRALVDTGKLERVSRGLYRLSDLPPLGNPDLVKVASLAPEGVICLISALAYYETTTQIPHQVHLAVQKHGRHPHIDSPPVRVYWFSGPAFTEGIEEHRIDEFTVRIYSPEKTIVDAFKFRNKIGLDVALEALRLAKEAKKIKVPKLLEFARVCRVERVMRPYLEAML